MQDQNVRIKYLCDVDGFRDFSKYAVDTSGNIWSFYNKKGPRKLRPCIRSKRAVQLFVRLTDDHGEVKQYYVSRLVALAFLHTDDKTRKVIHKNHDPSDNRVENLMWFNPNEKRAGYVLDKDVIEKIKNVHVAAVKKGLKVPDLNEFLNQTVNSSLDAYIQQYGLRRFIG